MPVATGTIAYVPTGEDGSRGCALGEAEGVAVDCAGCRCAERRVGHPVGSAGVACGYRQGGLAYRQGAVDIDHGVVAEVRTSRYRDDRIGPNRRAGRCRRALGEAEGVAVDRAGCRCGERRVGYTVGAAGVTRSDRQGGLAYRQGAVDIDHGVVREVRASRYRDDRIGSDRRARRCRRALGEAEGVAVHRAGRAGGEHRVGHPVGAAGVACGYRQGGLAYRQGAVDIDHGVVREVRTSRYRDDRIGPNRRAGRCRRCSR